MEQKTGMDPQLQALISLLDEPDQTSFSRIRDRIFAYGAQAVPMLESAWEQTFDAILQKRIEDIIHSIQFNQLYLEITNWSHFRSGNLLEGYLLFTRYQYPNMDTDEIRTQIQTIKRDTWLELNSNLTALEKVRVGASRDPNSVSAILMRNLMSGKFLGPVLPVSGEIGRAHV